MTYGASDTLTLMIDLGKQRASKNKDIFENGGEPEDYLDDQDFAIHDPWRSSCGRFEVDPFKEYGKSFVEWLMRPFYTDKENITRRLNENKRSQIQVLRPVDESTHVMTMKDWLESLDQGAFTPDDGFGHFAKEVNGIMSEDTKTDVWNGPCRDDSFTHVAWYNK